MRDRTALGDFVFAQPPPGFCDEDVFQGWFGQGDWIDLVRKRRRQASGKAAPSGCSIRTSSFRTLASTPNESAIFPLRTSRRAVRADGIAANFSPQFFRRASGHDPALVDDRHPIAALCFLHQMRGQKDSHVLLVAQAIKRLPKIDPRARIEPGRGLIKQ